MSRRLDVARLAGVSANRVVEVSETVVRRVLADRVPAYVLKVATQESARYWRADDVYYLDDPFFGPVAPMLALHYSSDLGLFVGTNIS